MLTVFLSFLIFALGLITGSIVTAFTALAKVERKVKSKNKDDYLEEKPKAEDDNPFEEDKEARKYKERFINFFS